MPTRMHLATTEERNAAFDAVYKELLHYVPQLPMLVQGQVKRFLESPEGKTKVLEVIDVALDAAEEVEMKQEAAAKAKGTTT